MKCKICGTEFEGGNICPNCGEAADDAVQTEVNIQKDDVMGEQADSVHSDKTSSAKPQKGGNGPVVVFLVIAAVIVAAACFFVKKSSAPAVDVSSINKTDAFEDIAEESIVDNYDEIVEIFNDAVTAVDNADSVTVDMTNTNKTGENNYDKIEFLMKRQYIDEALAASINIKQDSAYEADEESEDETSEDATGEAADNTAPNIERETNSVDYYYADNALYINADGEKYKIDATDDDMLGQLNVYGMEIYAEYISKAACVEKGKNKVYTISFDPEAYQQFMLSNMSAAGAMMSSDEVLKLNYGNIMFEIDENGTLVNYGFVLDLDDTISGETTNFNSEITVAVSGLNNTSVVKLSEEELRSYDNDEEETDAAAEDIDAAEETDAAAEEVSEEVSQAQ